MERIIQEEDNSPEEMEEHICIGVCSGVTFEHALATLLKLSSCLSRLSRRKFIYGRRYFLKYLTYVIKQLSAVFENILHTAQC
jgi:hypothetical protein